MKRKILIAGIILIIVGWFVSQNFIFKEAPINNLRNPLVKTLTKSPTPTLTPSPTPIIYDRSTDLKKELEKVNPQVNAADYKEIENLINSD